MAVSIPATGKLAALFRVPIDYVLELRVGGQILYAVSVHNYPDAVSLNRPHATSVRHTLGKEPVREATENRYRSVTISGNSGYRARAGYNRVGAVVFAPGPQILEEFDAFLNLYQEIVADDDFGVVDLVFRAFDESVNLRVEIESWSWDRNAGKSPHTREWQLTLKAYGDAAPNNPINLLSPVSEAFEAAAAAIDNANAYAAVALNAAVNLRGDLEVLRRPLQALQRSAQVTADTVDAARAVLLFPSEIVADLANIATEARGAWEGIVGGRADDPFGVNGWVALQGEWQRLQSAIGYGVEDASRDATTALGLSGGRGGDLGGAEARAAAVGPLDGHRATQPTQAVNLRAHQLTLVRLRAGETLRAVARRVLGDPERWIEIASYNGWQSAHRLGSGRPARQGDTVLVPVQAVDPELGSGARGDPYLRDLYVAPDGDLVFTPDGDLQTVRGAANLEQAIRLRMLTVKGESSGFPLYGLPLLVGTSGSSGTRAYVAAHVRDQLLRDPRVQSISALAVEDYGDTYTVEAEVVSQDSSGAALTVLAPLPTPA